MAILTPVIFRQNASSYVLQPLVILSIQIFSTAQYSIGFRNTSVLERIRDMRASMRRVYLQVICPLLTLSQLYRH